MLVDALGSIPPGLLYPHQADGVAFLISKGRVILGDRARKVSGQTPIVAWAAGVQAVSAAAKAVSAVANRLKFGIGWTFPWLPTQPRSQLTGCASGNIQMPSRISDCGRKRRTV